MGDRANITTWDNELVVYCHWLDGKLDGYLCYCYAQGFRCPEDDSYGWARLCQVIANDNRGGLSVGISSWDNMCSADDHGIYTIEQWHCIRHTDMDDNELPIERENYFNLDCIDRLYNLLTKLDSQMPEGDRLDRKEMMDKMYEWIEKEKEFTPIYKNTKEYARRIIEEEHML